MVEPPALFVQILVLLEFCVSVMSLVGLGP